jgi:2-amino-4-hydroxy-6-hydroxymethyldihydropteridine diphosphokinase
LGCFGRKGENLIVVAIGANLPGATGGTAFDTCAWAVGRLGGLPGLRLVAVSRWYRTAPVPASDQPDYCNGVAVLAGETDPAALLAALHAIEAQAGRLRHAVNAARTLDLDIIDMDGMCRADPPPVLPHPRAHLRRFVLLPLRDLAPGWVHPRLGIGIDDLIAAAPDDPVRLWDEG